MRVSLVEEAFPAPSSAYVHILINFIALQGVEAAVRAQQTRAAMIAAV